MDMQTTKPNSETKMDRGRQAQSPWQMPLAAWKDVAIRTWRESSDDDVGLVAAGVAFYGFLGLVPMLGAIVLTYGLVAEPQTVIDHMQSMTAVLPADVAKLVAEQLMNAVQTSGEKKGLGLVAALAIALWGARNAAGSIVKALNIAYEEEEKRGFIKVTLLALAMTVGAVVVALFAMGAVAVLGFLHHFFPDTSPVAIVAWKILSYVLLAFAAAGAVATLYRYGPSREEAKWTWITPGSLFAAIAWVLLTLSFGFYVANFGNYDATYGSLGAIVVLLTWMYLSSYVLLFGAELNSELEHQTARDTTSGAERPLGERGAWAADNVAGGTGKPGGTDAGQEAPHQPVAAHRPRVEAAPARRRDDADLSGPQRFLVARATNRTSRVAGIGKVGLLTSVLSTAGLSMLGRKGREAAGAALLATAAGFALLRRH